MQVIRQDVFQVDSVDMNADSFDEIIAQLKDKFSSDVDRDIKLKVLSVLPRSWSVYNITKEFKAPKYMVQQVKKLVSDQGILCSTTARSGHGISESSKQTIIEFYNNDDISRPMPGVNDFVSVLLDGKKEHVQKRLLMMSLKEAFMIFEETHKETKIGFTVFTQMRPIHCILLDSKGTHNCVCLYYS